ncbi:unnamed protein product [Rhizopus microsporus]
MRKRRWWAKDHKVWTVDQWKGVIWSDESWFTVLVNDVFGQIIRKRESTKKSTIARLFRHSVMDWSAVSGLANIVKKIKILDTNSFKLLIFTSLKRVIVA